MFEIFFLEVSLSQIVLTHSIKVDQEHAVVLTQNHESLL